MFTVEFYEDRDGNKPVADYIMELNQKALTSKEHRIRHKKIIEYLMILSEYGTRAGLPYVKHISGDIWELRPASNRIFFFYWENNTFILLHHFFKKTQKTPPREIEQAQRNLDDFLERSGK